MDADTPSPFFLPVHNKNQQMGSEYFKKCASMNVEESFLDVWKSVKLFNLEGKICFPATCMSSMRSDHDIIN